MRYYCKTCGTELIVGKDVDTTDVSELLKYDQLPCYFLDHGTMDRIPDYETPGQYEVRKGKPWPDDSLVWERHRYQNGCHTDYAWELLTYRVAKSFPQEKIYCDIQMVCPGSLDNLEPPPDDWRPL